MIHPLADEFLLVRGEHSFLLVAKANARFGLRIETMDKEYSQTVDPDDLIVVSAPEGGPLEPAIMLAEFVRTYRMPLIVLPKNHPGTRRFSCLVSVSPSIHTSCLIRRGTHPEQDVVCSSDELAGIVLCGLPGEVDISGLPGNINLQYVKSRILTEFSEFTG
jgi:hypothetical protein